MKKLISLFCLAASTAAAFTASSVLVGRFAFQGGKAITEGHLLVSPIGRDPLKEDPSTLVTIPIQRTMVGGRWVFEA